MHILKYIYDSSYTTRRRKQGITALTITALTWQYSWSVLRPATSSLIYHYMPNFSSMRTQPQSKVLAWTTIKWPIKQSTIKLLDWDLAASREQELLTWKLPLAPNNLKSLRYNAPMHTCQFLHSAKKIMILIIVHQHLRTPSAIATSCNQTISVACWLNIRCSLKGQTWWH